MTTARTDGHARAASRTLTVPMTLVSKVSRGSSYARRTSACAARWKITDGCAAWTSAVRRSTIADVGDDVVDARAEVERVEQVGLASADRARSR